MSKASMAAFLEFEGAESKFEQSLARAKGLKGYDTAKCGWLIEPLRAAAEAKACGDSEAAGRAFSQATRQLDGSVRAFLTKSPSSYFDPRFDAAKKKFMNDMDMIEKNFPDWTPDRTFESVQNFWDKRLDNLRRGPFLYKSDLDAWVSAYDVAHEALKVLSERFDELFRNRYSRAGLEKAKAQKVRNLELKAKREEEKIKKAGEIQAKLANPEVRETADVEFAALLAKVGIQEDSFI